jgi:hypothetical protein
LGEFRVIKGWAMVNRPLQSFTEGLPISEIRIKQLVDIVLGTVQFSIPSFAVLEAIALQVEPLSLENSILTKLEVR